MRRILPLLFFCTMLFAEEETVEPPKSFAREVLQPFGMPLVTAYHKIRENPFLNIARQEATGLEKLGDFFLSPSRYLFGGKNAALHEGKCETSPSFEYREYDGLKTTLSILALPVSEVLGCTFKGISFLFKSTRTNYEALSQSLQDTLVISQLEYYRKQGIAEFHCAEKAPCLGYVRPSVLPKVHQMEVGAFREVCQLLNAHKIIFWLDCGSCLGAYRYGGMIPWDFDIDISIFSADHENVKKILSKLDPERFQIQDWSSYKYPHTFLKLYLKETKTLIDIYHYTLDSKDRTLTYFYTYKDSAMPDSWKKGELIMTKPVPYDVVFPLKKTTFDGIETWAPHQIEEFLHYKYGANLTPTMIWDEKSQTYRKVKDHPYWKLVE
ncbi:MAG: LicD family protein [Verrucomicrobia bacterium]|nr:LicD family protein [Verrucomicrobiota bacterium]